MESVDFRNGRGIREELMAPLQNKLIDDRNLRQAILTSYNIAISRSMYKLPDTPLVQILRDLLPVCIRNIGLSDDEVISVFIRAKYAQMIKGETDKMELHPEVLLKNPGEYKYWLEKGTMIANSYKLLNNAIKCFNKAIDINPQSAYAWYLKGYYNFQLGKVMTQINSRSEVRASHLIWDKLKNLKNTLLESLNCFERAIEIDPEYVSAWYNKGTCLIEIGRPQSDFCKVKDAKECFRKVLATDPSHKNAQTALKMCDEALRNVK